MNKYEYKIKHEKLSYVLRYENVESTKVVLFSKTPSKKCVNKKYAPKTGSYENCE